MYASIGTNSTKNKLHQENTQEASQYLLSTSKEEATDDESSGSMEEYLRGEAIEPSPSLPWDTKATYLVQSLPLTRPQMKNHIQSQFEEEGKSGSNPEGKNDKAEMH